MAKMPCNFLVEYGDGECMHYFDLEDYATSAQAAEQEPYLWALLAVKPKGKGKAKADGGKAKGKGKARADAEDLMDGMSAHDQRKLYEKLRSRFDSYDDAAGWSDDGPDWE